MPSPVTRPLSELSPSTAGSVACRPEDSQIQSDVMGLYDQLRSPLLRYVLSFGISIHDGEEVTQEVFLALFRHLQMGKSRRNLRSWLFRVAHNLALKQRHANQKSLDRMELEPAVAAKQLDSSPSPEDQLSAIERRSRLLAVVEALPEEDQCCLRLRAEGLRYREISEVVGISLGAVSLSLTRSLARLIRADGM